MQDGYENQRPDYLAYCRSKTELPTVAPTEENQVVHLDSIQLARRLNISIKSLARMRQEGTGPRFLRIGARVIYRLSDVLEFEQSRLYEAVDTPVVSEGGQS